MRLLTRALHTTRAAAMHTLHAAMAPGGTLCVTCCSPFNGAADPSRSEAGRRATELFRQRAADGVACPGEDGM